MKLPRDLAGRALVKALCRIGTLNTILRIVSAHKGVDRAEILRSL